MNKAFLKWAGGKSQLVPKILSLMPEKHSGRFLEPFVGSGVVALNAPFDELVINDINPSVMACWNQLKSNGKYFIEMCGSHFSAGHNTEAMYYEKRELFNETDVVSFQLTNAILFVYLNRHCFNGLCRFNSKGKFNVPYGKPYFPRAEMEAAHAIMSRTSVHCLDFLNVLQMAKKGDVVYCDPPYIPLSETSCFTAYSKGGFGIDDQTALMTAAEAARNRGATVIISNNDTPLARKLYDGATEIHEVQVRKAISCKADGRKKSGEIIAVYRP
jgi:DNA adenine methylase